MRRPAPYRHDDPEFDRQYQQYQQLLDYAEQARPTAGFANANLKRALTPMLPGDLGFNYVSHTQLR